MSKLYFIDIVILLVIFSFMLGNVCVYSLLLSPQYGGINTIVFIFPLDAGYPEGFQ